MGRQVNFYLSNKDQLALLNILADRLGVVATDESIKRLPILARHPSLLAEFKVGKPRALLFLPTELQNLQVHYTGGKANAYFIDFLNGPIIDHWLCRTEGKMITRGRFWYDATYLHEDGNCYMKSDDFLEFAKKAFAITKRFCVRVGSRQELKLVGPDAVKLLEKGYVLEDQ